MTIKIRVWHKKLKEYIQPSKYAVIDKNGEIGNNNLVVEQFTGLHDKNGKEIYEGDILASGECIIGSVSYCTDPFCFYVAQFYITDGFGFAADESTLEDCDKHLSVVGNIHENPELLETQND